MQQQLEHAAGLVTLRSGPEAGGNRVSIHRAAVAYIEEISDRVPGAPAQRHCGRETSSWFDWEHRWGMRVARNQELIDRPTWSIAMA